MKSIKIKINKKIPEHNPGVTVSVLVDAAGTPILQSWRDRLKDAEIDNCVEIVKEPKTQTKNKTPAEDS